MPYTYSHLEDYINDLLRKIHIFHPWQLSLNNVAYQLKKEINYLPYPSMCIDGEIFLDERTSYPKHWQDFAHELGHVRLHEGDQALMYAMQKDYQEFKAENFAQHFCIPTFMLQNMTFTEYGQDPLWVLQETFGVEKEFANKRWVLMTSFNVLK